MNQKQLTPHFNLRHSGPELMDGENIPEEHLFQNYHELHAVNKWLGGYSITLKGLSTLLRKRDQTYSILDIGCGGGDMLNQVAKWGRSKNLQIELTGIDLSGAAIHYAQKNVNQATLIQEDVFDHLQSAVKYDVIMCTLFMHHFTNEKIVELLRMMRQSARTGIIINDLQRHPVAFHSIKWITGLFSKSYLVKNDAPLSVLRGFKKEEWIRMLNEAGMEVYSCKWEWAFRYLIVCRK